MRFRALSIAGAHEVTVERAGDERGWFGRLWCRESAARAGVVMGIEQTSASFNTHAGTVRGMHFAWPPAREAKVVRCARGRLHDVLLDLRPDSPAFGRWEAVVLDADEHNALVVPWGVAHGFQTLVDDTEVHYMMSEAYRPELMAGVRHDDPAFGIRWPLPVSLISGRDCSYPDFDERDHRRRHAAASAGAGDAA